MGPAQAGAVDQPRQNMGRGVGRGGGCDGLRYHLRHLSSGACRLARLPRGGGSAGGDQHRGRSIRIRSEAPGRRHRSRYRVFALTANGSADALLTLCRTHGPVYAVLSAAQPDPKLVRAFAECGTELLFGAHALEQVAADSRVDVVMAAIVGAA